MFVDLFTEHAISVPDINTDPPMLSEVKIAIKAMKSGKVGGLDGVTADMLQAEDVMTSIFFGISWSGYEIIK